VKNTLAYYDAELITAVKSLMLQATVVNDRKKIKVERDKSKS
jgi:hypothetical protein